MADIGSLVLLGMLYGAAASQGTDIPETGVRARGGVDDLYRCYECSSISIPNCSADLAYQKQCTDTLCGTNSAWDQWGNQVRFERWCRSGAPNPRGLPRTLGCTSYIIPIHNMNITTCICKGDLCNGDAWPNGVSKPTAAANLTVTPPIISTRIATTADAISSVSAATKQTSTVPNETSATITNPTPTPPASSSPPTTTTAATKAVTTAPTTAHAITEASTNSQRTITAPKPTSTIAPKTTAPSSPTPCGLPGWAVALIVAAVLIALTAAMTFAYLNRWNIRQSYSRISARNTRQRLHSVEFEL